MLHIVRYLSISTNQDRTLLHISKLPTKLLLAQSAEFMEKCEIMECSYFLHIWFHINYHALPNSRTAEGPGKALSKIEHGIECLGICYFVPYKVESTTPDADYSDVVNLNILI